MSDNKAAESLSGVMFAAAAVMQPLPATAEPVRPGFEQLKATPISTVNEYSLKPNAEYQQPRQESVSFKVEQDNAALKLKPWGKEMVSLKLTF